MPSIDVSGLPDTFVKRLEWFRQRAGTTSAYPAPMPDGTFLVSRPKGIFKPQGLEYALSIRINLDSPYLDGEIHHREDGTWFFSYHQENPDPAQRDSLYTNRAMMRCIADHVPVGVLRERVPDSADPATYEVLGTAVPVGWEGGYFLFEGVRPDGTWHLGDTENDVLLADAYSDLDASNTEPPGDDYDSRHRVVREIVARRGQPEFRVSLLAAYVGKCAVTGTAAEAALEAAHIRPYRGPESNTLRNGLLLRADIHTLFDLSLIAVDPSGLKVAISKALGGTTYADLDGQRLAVPGSEVMRPSLDALRSAWNRFVEIEETR